MSEGSQSNEMSSHEAIIEKFKELRSHIPQLAGKLNDLSAECAEHEGVVKALEQLDPDRKCFRLVGDVLVERTVEEVLPAVKSNKDQMDMLEGKVRQQLDSKKKELSEFQAKYKIKVRNEADPPPPAAEQQPGKSQGVLA